MDYINSLIIVFLVGIAELWLAVPLGLILKLSPINTAVISAMGSITAALIVAFAGSNLRSRFVKWRYGSDEDIKKGGMYKIWNKYGVIGLGLLSPLLFGALLGTALGIIFGAERNRLLLWITIGIVIWSVGLTAAVYMGIITLSLNI
ncbi:MAG TPA: small multi-drug export protein [Methanobacterium sp.]